MRVEPFVLTGNWDNTSLTSGWFPWEHGALSTPVSSLRQLACPQHPSGTQPDLAESVAGLADLQPHLGPP